MFSVLIVHLYNGIMLQANARGSCRWRFTHLGKESIPLVGVPTGYFDGSTWLPETSVIKESSSGDSERGPNGDDKGLGSPGIYDIISTKFVSSKSRNMQCGG